MRKLVLSFVASVSLLLGVAVTAPPASAAFNCGGTSIVMDTRHIGNGNGIAEWYCGSGSPGHLIPAGVTINRVQLWPAPGGYPVGPVLCTAYPSYGYAECHVYVPGGRQIRAGATATTGTTYLSATKTT